MEYNGYQDNNDAWSRQAEYKAYEEQGAGQQETTHQPEHSGGKGRWILFALVFGLVAGASFEASHYFFGQLLAGDVAVEEQAPVQQPMKKQKKTDTGTKAAAAAKDGSLLDVSGVVDNVMPSIVAITNVSEVTYRNWFGQRQNYETTGAGSGIIISEDEKNLYIATNNHVVANATSLTVQFCDDSTASAEVKGTSEGDDLAVVAVKRADIEADTLQEIRIATLGASGDLRVGDTAIAIGNALGYGQSVTTGVISALDREVSVQDESTGAVVTNELIQTDAAINPGNSGGALLNIRGEVIGINSVKFSDTAVEGVGYAIPIDTASPIITKLINRELVGKSRTAYLGVSGVDVSQSVAKNYNMPEGVYVYRVVEGSPAAEAGIVAGDIITAFDGTKIVSKSSMEDLLLYYEAGTTVTITVQRLSNDDNGQYQEQEIEVTLGSKN